jgi:hypothetical protein
MVNWQVAMAVASGQTTPVGYGGLQGIQLDVLGALPGCPILTMFDLLMGLLSRKEK